MLDLVSSLAFEMHASKGVFALLVGSGISRSAKIPTGWEITLDLITRVATLKGADTNGDPETWYRTQSGEGPDYSKLLDTLAPTQTQRQQLIRPFIEPSEEQRERGEKRPTPAHRAIAQLMAKGYVRVVITTNFDRLLEQAVADLGVHAAVISSADQVVGAVPLVHAGPTIIKLHGDYLDTRIKNTASELEGYAPELNQLLDRVLDEFGLIVCGWSADWDPALKGAIDRTVSRRFPTYWAARGPLGAAAAGLIERRSARVIQIPSADAFFDELEQKLRGLEAMNRPHPLSAALAVAMLKEYLAEHRHRIRLHDLILDERNRALKALDALKPDLNSFPAGFAVQAEGYEAALAILLPTAYHAGIWSDQEQVRPWADLISEMATRGRDTAGITVLTDLMAYPASLLLHAYLLGAVVGKNPAQFGALASTSVNFGGSLKRMTLGDRLNAGALISDGGQGRFRLLPTLNDKKVAASERVASLLRTISSNELGDKGAFDEAFARVELALSLGFAERESGDRTGDDFWSPVGRFCYQNGIARSIVDEWKADYARRGAKSDATLMAALTKPPRFDDVLRVAHRFAAFA